MSSGETREVAGSREEATAARSGLPVLSGVLLAAGIAGSLLGLLSSSAALVCGVALGTMTEGVSVTGAGPASVFRGPVQATFAVAVTFSKNCSFSVDSWSARVDAAPPAMTWATSSK